MSDKSPVVRERDVESYLVARVKAAGGDTRKVKWLCRNGAPDRFCFWPGGHNAFVELKRPGGKARTAQQREHDRLLAAGIDVRLVDSHEAVDRFIEEMTA